MPLRAQLGGLSTQHEVHHYVMMTHRMSALVDFEMSVPLTIATGILCYAVLWESLKLSGNEPHLRIAPSCQARSCHH